MCVCVCACVRVCVSTPEAISNYSVVNTQVTKAGVVGIIPSSSGLIKEELAWAKGKWPWVTLSCMAIGRYKAVASYM